MVGCARIPLVAALALVTASSVPAQTVRRNLHELQQEQNLLSPARVEMLKQLLQAEGLTSRQGRLIRPPVLDLACAGLIASCNGNNNTQPYMVASLPAVGYTSLETPPLGFMMRTDEAVVLVGRTPPPSAYFSFRSFIFSRFVEREDVRRPVFVSLGDPNNMLTLKTAGSARSDPYDRAFVLVAAADRTVRDRIVTVLHRAGYPDSIINLDAISPNLAVLGLDPTQHDELLLLVRLALWKPGYEEAGAAYLADAPVTVLRVTPEPAVQPADLRPLPVEKLRRRGTGQTELDLWPEVQELRRSILAAHADYSAEELVPAVWLEESFDALQRDVDVLGESRDALYLRTEGTFTLGEDEFLVVYGTNHEATGKATYANLAVYDACKACGIAGETSRRVAGSALDYVGAANPKAPHVEQLYAWKVSRDCGSEPRCTTVQTGPCPGRAALDTPLFIGFRAYVEPSTRISPAASEVVLDRVIRFTPRAPAIRDAKVTPETVTAPGTPAVISFRVESADNLDVAWTATLLPDHGCAALEPASGVVAGGNGDVAVQVTVPPGQKGFMTVVISARDTKGRRAKLQGVQPRFNY